MRILLCSHVFAPSIGGIETVSAILAEQFSRMGLAVTVVTQTPGDTISEAYEVVRRPTPRKLRALARQSDIIFQNNISLRTLLPLLFSGKPIVITHQVYVLMTNGARGWIEYCKLALLPLCHNIAISNSVAERLPVKSRVIGNPFETDEFENPRAADREKDIVFLGRLVSDKGCELVLSALASLKSDGICPTFTVIGDGPELPTLQRISNELGISGQVAFRGAMREGRGTEVAQHKIMVIPSIWEEPFGIVALEGIAAGCAIVASRSGGLPEAVGPCGIFFPKGDFAALAAILKELLADSSRRQKLASEGGRHLSQFQQEAVANRYLEFFQSILKRQPN